MNRTCRTRTQQQKGLRRHLEHSDSYSFFNILTGPDLLDHVESLLPEHREWLFPPTETLSMFLAQALSADRSCQRAVNEAVIKRVTGGLPECSTQTGAYCRARQRLPLELPSALVRHTGRLMAAHTPAAWRWRGRPVRLVDGTTVSMPDTGANQAAYPQPRSQQPGMGFPVPHRGHSVPGIRRAAQCHRWKKQILPGSALSVRSFFLKNGSDLLYHGFARRSKCSNVSTYRYEGVYR